MHNCIVPAGLPIWVTAPLQLIPHDPFTVELKLVIAWMGVGHANEDANGTEVYLRIGVYPHSYLKPAGLYYTHIYPGHGTTLFNQFYSLSPVTGFEVGCTWKCNSTGLHYAILCQPIWDIQLCMH